MNKFTIGQLLKTNKDFKFKRRLVIIKDTNVVVQKSDTMIENFYKVKPLKNSKRSYVVPIDILEPIKQEKDIDFRITLLLALIVILIGLIFCVVIFKDRKITDLQQKNMGLRSEIKKEKRINRELEKEKNKYQDKITEKNLEILGYKNLLELEKQ